MTPLPASRIKKINRNKPRTQAEQPQSSRTDGAPPCRSRSIMSRSQLLPPPCAAPPRGHDPRRVDIGITGEIFRPPRYAGQGSSTLGDTALMLTGCQAGGGFGGESSPFPGRPFRRRPVHPCYRAAKGPACARPPAPRRASCSHPDQTPVANARTLRLTSCAMDRPSSSGRPAGRSGPDTARCAI